MSLHLREANDRAIDALLEPVEHLRDLALRGTPVGDPVVERFAARWPLHFLDIVDTGVTEDLVHRLAERNPALRLLPNLAGRKNRER